MPSIEFERDQLVTAERHLERGRRLILQFEVAIASARANCQDTEEAERWLQTMREVMTTLAAHRAQIVRTIADLEAGRL